MRQKPSDQEFHAPYCPLKNTKSALFLVAYFSLTAYANWKGLHKIPARPDFVELPFAMFVAVMFARWLVAFTCLRERLVLGLVIVTVVAAEVERFVPAAISQHVETVKSGHLAFSLLGLLISLSMLLQSGRSPAVEPSNAKTSIALQPKQNLPILLVVTLTALVLGALLYFFPIRL